MHQCWGFVYSKTISGLVHTKKDRVWGQEVMLEASLGLFALQQWLFALGAHMEQKQDK